ncbi:PREDICTED: protein timeless homolog [Priapulus caudatus]|uniref:Protein timeless homolog n=1 Tax=Priapulus caudatus TaxID=37621 RepID=A0ABM1ECH3_PRICU|nr:PREDICTED: protein timeless homolog [Priapulus caudatus]
MFKYSARHSRFGGTYLIKDVKSISQNDVIYHRNQADVKSLSFDQQKTRRRIAKNKLPAKDAEVYRRSTLSVRLLLKAFCIQFLQNCYNPLMKTVNDMLKRQKVDNHDETYFLWSMRYFMEFNRCYKFDVALISETISTETFHYIQVNLENYYEMMFSDKKESKVWSRRAHLALKAYQELLNTVLMMDKSSEPSIVESARVIKSNIFYVPEYKDIFLALLRKYDSTKQPRSFLKDIVETNHLFMRMMEKFCQSNSHVMVQAKRKKKKKKKKQAKPQNTDGGPTEQQLEDIWDEVSGELSAIFQNRADDPLPMVAPFDAASDAPVDQQKADAVIRIQDAMRENRPAEAVALFRSAREVWPEDNEFGAADIGPEEEFMALREVFYANIPRPEVIPPATGDLNEPVEEGAEEEGEEEEYERLADVTCEKEFNFKDFLKCFANPTILKPYAELLKYYRTNEPHTNHCLVKMMHRVAFDLKMVPLLFQASMFRVLQAVLKEQVSGRSTGFKELGTFAKYVVSQFFSMLPTNPKLVVELLFWKTAKDVNAIESGYDDTVQNASRSKMLWTEEQESELERLFYQYKDVEDPEKDVIDLVAEHLMDSKTRKQIVFQLKQQGLISSSKDLKKHKVRKSVNVWQEEEEYELKRLYEEFKDADDPVARILDNMIQKRSRNKVIEKCLSLSIVQDRKQLHKKRKRRRSAARGADGDNADDMPSDDASDLEQGLPSDLEEDILDSPTASSADSTSGSSDEESDKENGKQGDSSDFGYLVNNAVQKDLLGAVQWLKTTLERTATDRDEEDEMYPVPIVPLTEEYENALEEATFTKLLKALGLSPPITGQEQFWRVPAALGPGDLRERAEVLAAALEGRAIPVIHMKPTESTKKLQKTRKARRKQSKEGEKETRARRRPERNETRMESNSTDGTASGKRPAKRKGRKKESNILKEVTEDFFMERAGGGSDAVASTYHNNGNSDSSDDDAPLARKLPKSGKTTRRPRKPLADDDSDLDALAGGDVGGTTRDISSKRERVGESAWRSEDGSSDADDELPLFVAASAKRSEAERTLDASPNPGNDEPLSMSESREGRATDTRKEAPNESRKANASGSRRGAKQNKRLEMLKQKRGLRASKQRVTPSDKVPKRGRVRRTFAGDSDDEEEGERQATELGEDNTAAQLSEPGRTKRMLDSDSSDSDGLIIGTTTKQPQKRTRMAMLESESEIESGLHQVEKETGDTMADLTNGQDVATTRTRSSSESEVDDHIVLKSVKRRAVVESDSE